MLERDSEEDESTLGQARGGGSRSAGLAPGDTATDARQALRVEAPIILALGTFSELGGLESHPAFGQIPSGFAHSFSFRE